MVHALDDNDDCKRMALKKKACAQSDHYRPGVSCGSSKSRLVPEEFYLCSL